MGIFGGVVKALEILNRRICWCLSVQKVVFPRQLSNDVCRSYDISHTLYRVCDMF